MSNDTPDAIPRLQPGTRHGGGLAPHSDLPDRWVAVINAARAALDVSPKGSASGTQGSL